MNKIYRIKNSEDLKIKGKKALYCTWAEQILINKLAEYNRTTNINPKGYVAVAETEKAVKLKIDNIFKYIEGGKDTEDCEPWDIWMPKSALIAK